MGTSIKVEREPIHITIGDVQVKISEADARDLLFKLNELLKVYTCGTWTWPYYQWPYYQGPYYTYCNTGDGATTAGTTTGYLSGTTYSSTNISVKSVPPNQQDDTV